MEIFNSLKNIKNRTIAILGIIGIVISLISILFIDEVKGSEWVFFTGLALLLIFSVISIIRLWRNFRIMSLFLLFSILFPLFLLLVNLLDASLGGLTIIIYLFASILTIRTLFKNKIVVARSSNLNTKLILIHALIIIGIVSIFSFLAIFYPNIFKTFKFVPLIYVIYLIVRSIKYRKNKNL